MGEESITPEGASVEEEAELYLATNKDKRVNYFGAMKLVSDAYKAGFVKGARVHDQPRERKTGRAEVSNWIIVRVVDNCVYDTEISSFAGSANDVKLYLASKLGAESGKALHPDDCVEWDKKNGYYIAWDVVDLFDDKEGCSYDTNIAWIAKKLSSENGVIQNE